MSRALIVIGSDSDRQRAIHWASRAPVGTRIEFKDAKRTLAQNDRLWAMLTDIAAQVVYHGVKLNTNDWKLVFLDALRRETGDELRLVPNLDNTGLVNLGSSSSDLTVAEMTGLIEIMFKFGAEQNVTFQDTAEIAA